MGDLTRRRLGLLRQILAGLDGQGWNRVTSRDLGRWVGATPDTIRKDLAGIGPGTPGAAYEVAELRRRLDALMPPPPARKTVLAGLGPLGLALVGDGTMPGPWTFVAGFDGRPNRLETVEVPFPIHSTTEIVPVCLRLGAEAAVLALAPGETQKVAERFVLAGVRFFVNYSTVALRVDRNKIEVWEFGGTTAPT
jgi:NADH/NAD ratio-sensing transcriptional regulator Rex